MAGSGFFKYSSPASFYPLAGRLVPVFGWLAAALTVTGLYIGFVILFAVGVWYVYRLVRGFVRMHDGKGVW